MKISAGQCSFDHGFYCKHLVSGLTYFKKDFVKASFPDPRDLPQAYDLQSSSCA